MGKSQNFSPASIDALQSGARQDPLTAGLCVIANGDGRKIWRFRRRVAKSGTVVTIKLGLFPAYSILAARKWASALNEMIERGEDPRVAIDLSPAIWSVLSENFPVRFGQCQLGDSWHEEVQVQ